METQDFQRPRQLKSSIFDLQLQQQSTIGFKTKGSNIPRKSHDKYKQQQDQQINIDFDFPVHLGEVSSFQKIPSVKNKDIDQQAKTQNKKADNNRIPVSRVQRKGGHHRTKKSQSNQKAQKKQINIDDEIGEVAQWGQIGTKQNKNQGQQESEKQSDFQNSKQVEESAQTQQIRKRIAEKLKRMEQKTNKNSGAGSLKAKAEQLRAKNMNKSVSSHNHMKNNHKNELIKEEQEDDQQLTKNSIQVPKSFITHPKIQNNKHKQTQSSQEDDHWNNINKQTMNKQKQNQTKKKNLTHQVVITFFKNLDVSAQILQFQADNQEIQQAGCLAIFGCFKTQRKQYSSAQKQLLGLSRIQLQSREQDNFIMKEIWVNLTNKPYLRYGDHWRQIGFQGRDPSTDLRGCGTLSVFQWCEFITKHPKLSEKIYNFTIQMSIPLALTQIKITSQFITLLRGRKIYSENYGELQQAYNCLTYGFFESCFKINIGEANIGDLIDKNIEAIGKKIQNALKNYKSFAEKQSK